MPADTPPVLAFRTATLGSRKPTRFTYAPDDAARAAPAKRSKRLS